MGCLSQGQHPEGVPSEALGWLPAPCHQQHPWPGGKWRRGSPFPRKRPPSQLLPSPEAAAFLRWAISSLLHSGNANSRAAWKEVIPPERFRSALKKN